MRLFIDADGGPVVNEAVSTAQRHGVEVILLCDTAHLLQKEGARTITVSKGADSVDFALVNLLQPGDIAVTQDYGLAAMCLARQAVVLNQDGLVYNSSNIGPLLQSRHMAQKIRRSGGRLRGPAKRKPQQTAAFVQTLENLLSQNTSG